MKTKKRPWRTTGYPFDHPNFDPEKGWDFGDWNREGGYDVDHNEDFVPWRPRMTDVKKYAARLRELADEADAKGEFAELLCTMADLDTVRKVADVIEAAQGALDGRPDLIADWIKRIDRLQAALNALTNDGETNDE